MEDSKKMRYPATGNRRQPAALIGGVVPAHAVQNGYLSEEILKECSPESS